MERRGGLARGETEFYDFWPVPCLVVLFGAAGTGGGAGGNNAHSNLHRKIQADAYTHMLLSESLSLSVCLSLLSTSLQLDKG